MERPELALAGEFAGREGDVWRKLGSLRQGGWVLVSLHKHGSMTRK